MEKFSFFFFWFILRNGKVLNILVHYVRLSLSVCLFTVSRGESRQNKFFQKKIFFDIKYYLYDTFIFAEKITFILTD